MRPEIERYEFLAGMYTDSYFPNPVVDKVKNVLLQLCSQIEEKGTIDSNGFLALTHAATERINDLAEEFEENGSELETVAREVMAADFGFIADTYGFGDLDIEDIIEPRDW